MIEQYELRRNETQITIRDPFTLCLTFKKTVRIMENPTLPTNWLAALSNARSASRWVTLVQQEPRRHDTAD